MVENKKDLKVVQRLMGNPIYIYIRIYSAGQNYRTT